MYSTELPTILCSMANESLQEEMKKETCKQTNQTVHISFVLTDIQMFFKKKNIPFNGIAPTTGAIYLFNISARN